MTTFPKNIQEKNEKTSPNDQTPSQEKNPSLNHLGNKLLSPLSWFWKKEPISPLPASPKIPGISTEQKIKEDENPLSLMVPPEKPKIPLAPSSLSPASLNDLCSHNTKDEDNSSPGNILDSSRGLETQVVVDPLAESYSFMPLKNMIVPSDRILFHILANEFGSSSELEGANHKIMVGYLTRFLSLSHYKHADGLLEELKNVLDFPSCDMQSLITARKKIIDSFKKKNPLLVCGGWTGNPSGHAIYYEILPNQKNDQASFRLYNTGAGCDVHPSAILGNKLKYQAYLEWKGIDKENFLSPSFIKALSELEHFQSLPSGKKTEYNEKDIYLGLKSLLKPQEESTGPQVEEDNALWMSPQNSGVCAWRSLMAFLHTQMKIEDYKRFVCDIKMQVLKDYFDSYLNNAKNDRKENLPTRDWHLIKKSIQKLSRSLIKLNEKGIVGDRYLS